MDVLANSDGEFHIKLHIRNKADNFTWTLVAVCGAAQDEFKAEFLLELVNLEKDNPYPILIGGDFSLLRFPNEKSHGRFDDHWPFLFNVVIDCLDLREISMIGRQFTWAKSLPEPTYEKLDRVLMDTDWESKFPMVSVRALPHIEAISDHAPILLTTDLPRHNIDASSSSNLGGCFEMASMTWSRRCGRNRWPGLPQFTNGITKCVHYVNFLVVRLGIRWVSSERRSFAFHLSLMN